ncbi:hypothetical protein AA983_03235 [Dermacoccus sp. PE3]|nr:hypothetical protein AA983_03235 [Dermacoccus sp. PE3]
MGWRDAIIRVLEVEGGPLHYASVARKISDSGLRKKVGATPAATVAAVISESLRKEGDASPFLKVDRGLYALRAVVPASAGIEVTDDAVDDSSDMGLINAFGMFWQRGEVLWTTGQGGPRLFGQQQTGSVRVDFSQQAGVYLLHDGSRVVYVGQASPGRLGARLGEHTRDRLSGRWDRFSWFGVCSVKNDGTLSQPPTTFTLANLISTMEAILIEGLEPPQNRRQGDGFSAVEFLQAGDPARVKTEKKRVLSELSKMLDDGS